MSWRSWQETRRVPFTADTPFEANGPREETRASSGAETAADAAAFNALVERHAHEMLAVAAAIVGRADGEDAAQEAVVRAWQAWPTLRERDAFSSWLLRITVNVCRDWLRGRFGTTRRLIEPLDEQDAVGIDALFAADPGASDHMAALDLRHAIGTLPRELRLVVALRYYAGLDATHIGAALGVPSATVRTRLRRALSLLRERLDGVPRTAPHS
jgi:RNA polymerase sigma-70 factor (ECF subfamily)